MVVKMNRRQFLRGTGGVLVAIPFLPSIAGAQSSTPLKRFVSVRTMEGAYDESFWPEVLANAPKTKLAENLASIPLTSLPSPLSSIFDEKFNAFKSKMLMVSGLNPLVKYRGHNSATMLGSSNTEMTSVTPPLQPTIDQIIARKSTPAPLDFFNCFVSRYTGFMKVGHVWLPTNGVPVRAEGPWDPKLNFQKFFGPIGVGAAELAAKQVRRKLVVDQVLESFKSFLSSRRVSASEAIGLQDHIENLYEIEKKIGQLPSGGACSPPPINVDRDWKSASRYTNLLYSKSWIEQIIDLNIDIAVAAMKCNLTQVVNFQWQEHLAAAAASHHNIHHSPYSAYWVSELLKIDSWYATKLSHLLTKMDAVRESNGKTLLENSLVMYGKEMSAGNSHKTVNFESALFGGLNGKVKMNQFIFNENNQWRSYNQFLITIMLAYGLKPSDWEINGEPGYGQYHIANNATDRNTLIDKVNPIPGILS